MLTQEEMLSRIVELLTDHQGVDSVDTVGDGEVGVEMEDGSTFFIRVQEA